MTKLNTPPPLSFVDDEHTQVLSWDFEVITPVFGGGVYIDSSKQRSHLKEIDQITPIRVSGIIGQLRFWWRAIEGVRYPNLEALHKAEGLIWGTGEKPGLVTVWLEGQPKSTPITDLNSYAYGTFPLRSQERDVTELGSLYKLEGSSQFFARVKAHDSMPDLRTVIELVFETWLHFGGVGGRTRRGFGAVAPTKGQHEVAELFKRIKQRRPEYPQHHQWMPSLHGPKDSSPYKWAKNTNTAENVLSYSLNTLKRFRQAPGLARRKGSGSRPGRSHWPEPDEIRRATGDAAPNHQPINESTGFPRANFGMPIIVKFKDEKKGNKEGDPKQSTIKPKSYERMASPLMIRPLKVGSKNYRGFALYLHIPQLEDLALSLEVNKRSYPITNKFEGAEHVPVMKQNMHRGGHDPILAFMNFFSEN